MKHKVNGGYLCHGDCLEVMRSMKPQSVDLVFGSPPYEAQRTYGIGFNLKGQDWVDWMVGIVDESLRVCRGLVAFVVEGFTEDRQWSATPALLMADLHRKGVTLRKPPIYRRVGIPGSGGGRKDHEAEGGGPDWLRNDYEFIVCCTNGGKLPWADGTACGHPPKWAPGGEMSHRMADGRRVNEYGVRRDGVRIGARRGKDCHKSSMETPDYSVEDRAVFRQGKDDQGGVGIYRPPPKANPGNVVMCVVGGGGKMGSVLAHEGEAAFPESLANFFVKSFCKPGGTVLDPFGGSGTTASVAVKTGRRFVSIDVRESQIELQRRRVAEAHRRKGIVF